MFTWKPKIEKIEIHQKEFNNPCVTSTYKYYFEGHKFINWLWFTFKFKFKDFVINNGKITFSKPIPKGTMLYVWYRSI